MRHRRLGAGGVALSVALATTVVAGAAPVTAEADSINLWVNSAEAQPLKDLYAGFEEETGIKVDVTSFPSDGFETALMQRWATGDRPDVLQWHANFNWLAAINPTDNLRDITDTAAAAAQMDGVDAGAGGVTYGVVLNTPTAFGIYYNKPLFEELGLTPPTTAQEVMETCLAIKEAKPDVTPLRESAGSLWTPLVFHGAYMADALEAGFMDRLNAREAKVDDEDSPWLRANEFYLELSEAGCFNDDNLTAQFETTGADLMAGTAAMASMHSGLIPSLLDEVSREALEETIGWTAWSETRPVVTVEYSPIGTYYLPKTGDADREAAAMSFLEFITGPAYADYVVAAGMVPTLKDVPVPDSVSTPQLQIQEAVAGGGTALPIWVPLPGITDLVNYPSQLLTGDLTPESAVELLQKQAELGAQAAGLPAWPAE